jgi:hypothetical protein
MKWQKKLNKTQIAHLREHGITTLESFKDVRTQQREARKFSDSQGLDPGVGEPCWECKEIAERLGVE